MSNTLANGMRYILVDFNHMAYKFFYGAKPLSSVVNINGVDTIIDTTVAYGTIRALNSYGQRGKHFIGICYEGGSKFRKEYFSGATSEGYKGTRKSMDNKMKSAIDISIDLLAKCGAAQYRCLGYEADDMIYSIVKRIKEVDNITPIDIITGDADMLPLVDEQVSVYMKGTRTFSFPDSPEYRGYTQVTPDSWEQYLKNTSAYKDYLIPYNSMLLFKLMKGDKADNIPATTKGYGGKGYTALMQKMLQDGIVFSDAFRYGNDFDESMKPILSVYFDNDTIERMKWVYGGMNLRNFEGNIAPLKQLPIDKVYTIYSKIGITKI